MRAWALALLAGTAACGPSGEPSTTPLDATAAAACGPAVGTICACDFGATSSCASEPACPDGGSTTISGTIYDPANVNPVYNVNVYVPRVPLPALPEGPACASCANLLAAPRAAALTDATGRFTIRNAPDGQDLPLVVQVGKWRMVYTIGSVVACQDNPQRDHSLHLPRSHIEGNLPNIAISTGGADSMECLPLRMGVDAAEYVGGAAGPGRIHIFTGYQGAMTPGGTSPTSARTLWDSDTDINRYDVVVLSCEGQETMNMNQAVLLDYANIGGQVFASHSQYAWFSTGPFAANSSPPLVKWTPGAPLIDNLSGSVATTLTTGTPFSGGVAMNRWLGTVGALTGGELPMMDAFHNADLSATSASVHAWISGDPGSAASGATEYLSLDTPLNVASTETCGHVVYSDLHVSLGPGGGPSPDYPGLTAGGVVPDGCSNRPLTPQEMAFEFLFFDMSSCPAPSELPPPPTPESSSSGGTGDSGNLDAARVDAQVTDGPQDSPAESVGDGPAEASSEQ